MPVYQHITVYFFPWLAAYMFFMRSYKAEDGAFYGTYQGKNYRINDSFDAIRYEWWKTYPDNPVKAILSDVKLWDRDLSLLPGLVGEVEKHLLSWIENREVKIIY